MTLPAARSPRRAERACHHSKPLPRWRRLLAAGLLAATYASAHAAPDVLPDAVTRFLAEHGLSGEGRSDDAHAEAAPGVFEQVRTAASELVLSAINFLGVPYRRGGESQDEGFDCSGFTRHVFGLALGLVLPHRADEQALAPALLDVSRDELAPGDLVFFNTLRRTFSHVGIYLGDGKFIHAPHRGSRVRIEDMRGSYWARRFDGARRAPAATERHAS